jgi:hypothetical protein
MKRKTVITTEKHEVWIIRQEAEESSEIEETGETTETGTDSLVPSRRDPKPLAEKNEN